MKAIAIFSEVARAVTDHSREIGADASSGGVLNPGWPLKSYMPVEEPLRSALMGLRALAPRVGSFRGGGCISVVRA